MRHVIDDIIEYEAGTLTDEEAIDLFQRLIDNGLISNLQGHYGRTANALIETGYCKRSA